MSLFKKKNKPEVIKVDENRNVINPNAKKEKGKDLGKKLLIGALGAVGGLIAFVGVGVAMTLVDEKSSGSNTIDVGDGTITFTPNDDQSNESETESTGTSEE